MTLDMFLVLKKEIDTNLIKIINGTYIYEGEFRYLNRIPLAEREIIIEKIMHIANGREYQDNENPLDYLDEFITNFKKMSKSSLRGNHLLNIKYELILRKSRHGKVISKKNMFKFSALILSIVLVANLSIKTFGQDDAIKGSKETFETVDENILEESEIKTLAMTDYAETAATMSKNIAEKLDKPKNEIITEPVEETVKEELTLEEKIQNILIEQNLTKEQFYIICAIVSAEAKGDSYEDAYWVINTMYNRINSKTWVDYVSGVYGIENAGLNLYYQAVMSGQFVAYEDGRYKEFLGNEEACGFLATVDFLTTKELAHYYLSFRSAETNLDEYVESVPGGNKYFNAMSADDRLNRAELSK